MARPATDTLSGGDVRAFTSYAVNDGVVRPYGQGTADERVVVFHDLRGAADQPALDREGFCLAGHPTSVTDFSDHDQIITRYLPEIGELLRRLTRAPAVFMQQNWVFRGDDKEVATEAVNERNRVTTMKTHGVLHADYYEQETAEALASMSMKAAGVTERPRGRLLGINTWRSISPPPQDRPLALLDRRTLDAADFVPAVIEGPHAKLNALQASYNERHRFCWWSDMTPDEVLVFLQYEQGRGQPSTVMHTAFTDPRCPAGTLPRQSIEARAYVFLDD
jgi:hypothetical protein